MGDLFFYFAAFIFVIALIVLGAWLWRTMLDRGISVPGTALFKAAKDKRIGAIETASIDSRRKLVLIRRDGVEHLIMTGGPVDVLIETGIEASAGYQASLASASTAPSYSSSSLERRLNNARGSDATSSFSADD